jgi:hypothetical protein
MNDRDDYLESRDNVLERSWVTELWMRVIQKAIDDLALFTRMHEDGEFISEENMIYANTAYNFLFNPEYTIQIGDIEITVEELISLWGCENPTSWREILKEKIDKLVIIKRKAVKTRRSRNEA